MKKKTAPKRQQRNYRTTPKQRHSQQFLKVYWPYIPLFALVFFGLVFGYNWKPTRAAAIKHHSVLSYATEMSSSGLLSATNAQRSQNGGLPALSLNSKLTAAAQAKANDMIARNYWSHDTPDGKAPWTFMDAAGYVYQKAGENLAYGFDTSSDTVIGWMNSPGHRANILDSAYKEVGFGFANGSDFVGTGEETVVVAMYGDPAESAVNVTVSTPAPSAPAAQPKAAAVQGTQTVQPTIQDTVVPSSPAPAAPAPKKISKDRINQPITSESPIPAAQPTKSITRLQSLTGGRAPWSAAALSIVVLAVVAAWALKHLLIVKRVLVDGEEFLMHHPIIDVAVLCVVAVSILLSQSSGVIK